MKSAKHRLNYNRRTATTASYAIGVGVSSGAVTPEPTKATKINSLPGKSPAPVSICENLFRQTYRAPKDSPGVDTITVEMECIRRWLMIIAALLASNSAPKEQLSFVVPLLTAISGIFAGALATYFNKPAEVLAMKAALRKVLEHTTAITERTKTIEAKIGYRAWNQQRRWDLKKDTRIEVLKQLGTVLSDLIGLVADLEVAKVQGLTELQKESI